MAYTFSLRRGGKHETELAYIEREIKERVDGCMRPQCWIIKDDKDIGQLYIGKKMMADGVGRHVYMRRYLFLLTYGDLPARRKIDAICGDGRCVNPAHATYKGWKIQREQLDELIYRNWITEEQVKELKR